MGSRVGHVSDNRADPHGGGPADGASGDRAPDASTSPYDDPTGQIPVPTQGNPSVRGRRRPPADADRDSFYDRHARAPMSRVDDLDDLDPGEVETRQFGSRGDQPGDNRSPAADAGAGPDAPARDTTGPAAPAPDAPAPEATAPRGRRRPVPMDAAGPDSPATETAADSAPPATERFEPQPGRAAPTRVEPARGGPKRGEQRRSGRSRPDTDVEPAAEGTEANDGDAGAYAPTTPLAAAATGRSETTDPGRPRRDDVAETDLTEPELTDRDRDMTAPAPMSHPPTPAPRVAGPDHGVAHEDDVRGDGVRGDGVRDGTAYGDGETDGDDGHRSRRESADADALAEAERRARRGTLDLGLLLLRAGVGAIMVAHGLQKLFGWWNGPGLDGFEDMLVNQSNTAIGFQGDWAQPLAIVGALSETIGGVLLVLGLLTPIAASAVLGVMLVAAAYKTTLAGGFSFFAAAGGVEFELLLALCAAVIILTGPGLYSLDNPRGWARRPFLGSAVWLVVGIAAAVAVWILTNGTNPFSSPGNPG